uniref:Uncharacterized protein n=1 Tax=Sus scrofa TaxID=9823 RepID=A0A4X1TF01_PIG
MSRKYLNNVITRRAHLPTWGQIKLITQEAENLLRRKGKPLTPNNLVLALFTLVSIAVRDGPCISFYGPSHSQGPSSQRGPTQHSPGINQGDVS